MINSKDIKDLHPYVQAKAKSHLAAVEKRGVKAVITSTLRDKEYQEYLFAQGRTRSGIKVTNTKLIGAHGFGLAYDMVPDMKPNNGKDDPTWDISNPAVMKAFQIIAEEGRKLGAVCGADWKSLVDRPHYEYTDRLTYTQLRAGLRPRWYSTPIKAAAPKGVIKPYAENDKHLVKELQELLNKHGYKLIVDGGYGIITQGAVRDFQHANGLKVDAIVGPATWSILTS